MTQDDQNSLQELDAISGNEISTLTISSQGGVLYIHGEIKLKIGSYSTYQSKVGPTLASQLKKNEEGRIAVTHKQLRDNAYEIKELGGR